MNDKNEVFSVKDDFFRGLKLKSCVVKTKIDEKDIPEAAEVEKEEEVEEPKEELEKGWDSLTEISDENH